MKIRSFFFLGLLAFLPACSVSSDETATSTETAKIPLWGDAPNTRPQHVRGIHLTSWVTGSKKRRVEFEKLFAETELNTAVIDVKEIEGEVYIKGVKLGKMDPYTPALGDIQGYLKYLKDRGIFTIARIVVFKDQKLAREKPEWAVQSSTPQQKSIDKGFNPRVWVDMNGKAWGDPYNKHVWDYNIDIAEKAVELGFQGVQFDYIRFPSDGETKKCRYSKPHNSATAVQALAEFLERAHGRLKKHDVEISIDVFGLVGSYENDLGIGQRLSHLLGHIDVLSPMTYPSHYAPGEFGLKDPNSSPYETITRSIGDTAKGLQGKNIVLRPWLQDFSLGVKYTPKLVRDQIEAAAALGVHEWLLWNPKCVYTRAALKPFPEQEKTEAPTK